MPTKAMMRKGERRLRELLAEGGFAQPECVEHQGGSITLLWPSVNKSIVVDIADDGSIGESRLGPPLGDRPPLALARGMPLERKIACERDVRNFVDRYGLEQPDEVGYGEQCIRLFWYEPKLCLVIDITDPPDGEDDPGP